MSLSLMVPKLFCPKLDVLIDTMLNRHCACAMSRDMYPYVKFKCTLKRQSTEVQWPKSKSFGKSRLNIAKNERCAAQYCAVQPISATEWHFLL